MEAFSVVNDELRLALTESRNIRSSSNIHKLTSAENIASKVRELISIDDLRGTGSFFTGDKLAVLAIENLPRPITKDSICFDPTCGIGNLLIAASKFLPINKSLERTIRLWGKVLRGYDLHPEFIECAKLRLIHEAITRGAAPSKKSVEELEKLLPFIKVGDVLENLTCLKVSSHLLLNPPYNLKKLTKPTSWGAGKVNMAAVFLDHVLHNVNNGTAVTAILPDVLRAGSRYAKWRELISNCMTVSVEVSGKFDSRTDVDVVNVYGQTQDRPMTVSDEWMSKLNGPLVGDYFVVSVGPLVAYRDHESGPNVPYIFPKMLSKWSEMTNIKHRRKTKIRLIKPPFVVVNRTSSPSDKSRAIGTLIRGSDPVAVENHLIVLQPISGGLKSCRNALDILKSSTTNNFLNNRIRCRHLTVGSVGEIPWRVK